jgi:MOSC domain-containing protein YiiM
MSKEVRMTGRVVAVCTSEKTGTRKTNVGRARLIVEHGLEGDAHAGPWHRQVSFLAQESANKVRGANEIRAHGLEIGPGDFAENILTEGLELFSLPIGTRMRVGPEVEVEVTQIGKECHTGCAIRQLTGDCVMPREGIFARVLRGGMVQVGDEIEIETTKAQI